MEITGTSLGEIIAALAEGYGGYVRGDGSTACGDGSEESSWGCGGATSKAEVGAAVAALMRALAGAGRFALASKLLPAGTLVVQSLFLFFSSGLRSARLNPDVRRREPSLGDVNRDVYP